MEQFSLSVDSFLSFRQYKILGTVSRQHALSKAHSEYDKFNKTQKIDSDFDHFIKSLPISNKKTN